MFLIQSYEEWMRVYIPEDGGESKCQVQRHFRALRCSLNSKMHVHQIVSFLVGVMLDLLQLKFSGNGNQKGGVSSDDSSMNSPFNAHPMMILLGVVWLLLYSWVALAAAASSSSSSSPTSDSPSNGEVVASHLSAAAISPSPSSPAPASTSAKITVAETPCSSASVAASCSSSAAPAASSNALSSSVKMVVAETPLSPASAATSCSPSPASSSTLSSPAKIAVVETPRSSTSAAASCSSSPAPATSPDPSLLSQRDAATVLIMIPTSSPTVALSATSSSWRSTILGKLRYPASKLTAKIRCPREQLMLMFASMTISTFGCLLLPTSASAQYHVICTSYALIIALNAIFLRFLPSP